jgi:nucleotide-binding universal stress UspA family protein
VTPRRILVAVDLSAPSLAALEIAAKIAARLEAELVGLFVEDSNLLRLASLPFAAEMGYLTRTPRPLDSRRIERSLQMLAARAKREMAERAGRLRLRWSFRVVRGRAEVAVREAAVEADIVALGRASRESAPRRHLGSTAIAALAATRTSLLLLPAGPLRHGPAIVAIDDSDESGSAVPMALELTPAVAEEMVVVIAARSADAAEQRRERIRRQVDRLGVAHPRFRTLVGSDPDARELARITVEENASFLVLPVGGFLSRDDNLRGLLDRVDCPVLVTRAAPGEDQGGSSRDVAHGTDASGSGKERNHETG